MNEQFQEIEIVWKVRVVAKRSIARTVAVNVKEHLDAVSKKIPDVLVGESVVSAMEVNNKEVSK